MHAPNDYLSDVGSIIALQATVYTVDKSHSCTSCKMNSLDLYLIKDFIGTTYYDLCFAIIQLQEKVVHSGLDLGKASN